MKHLSKQRGAISVFLLIIFMVTYVFIGLLVDAGRYRMAETYLESALDNASNSILAGYNQLLFDLYGLFSVDIEAKDEAEVEKKIQELYEHYLEETLGLIETDTNPYKPALVDAIFNKEEATVDTGDLYDFQITELNAGSVVTLADTANVENQIIEYMKFRAPVQLVNDMDGFLEKMKEILTMKDRIEESLTKAKITKKYEEPENGEQSLSEEAEKLLKDINKMAVALYHYAKTPYEYMDDDTVSTLPKPSRETVVNEKSYKVQDLVSDFDSRLRGADSTFQDDFKDEISLFEGHIKTYMRELRDAIGNGGTDYDVELENSYKANDGSSQTKLLSKIEDKELEEKIIDIAEDVYAELTKQYEAKKEQEGWNEREEFKDFRTDYGKERKVHKEKLDEINNNRKAKYEEAEKKLKDSLKNIESNATWLHKALNELRDRITNTVGRYEAYIGELEAELNKNPDDQNKKTVYAPDIELAKANAGEILKNLELLMNSRQYLLVIGQGSDQVGYLSSSLGKAAEEFVKERNEQAEKIENIEELDQWKTSSYLENMIETDNSSAAAVTAKERIPEVNGQLASLYSLISYFYDGHYRRDVDVRTEITETKIDTNEVASKTEERFEGDKPTEKESEKLQLDNQEMLKASDYPDYLKVNYLHTAPKVDEEQEDFSIDNEKVSISTMIKILDFGKTLIKILEGLLENARDNLYVDAYVMSLFPNYYEYNLYNRGNKSDEIKGNAFEKEYQKYNASYAEVEFIITGAGGKNPVFSNKIKAPEAGKEAEGFGKLSVSAMRVKLFGTRLLFNCIAMFTDSAKYSQASSLAAWAGPFAPLVTVVLMVAWAVAETAIDVIILMGDNATVSESFNSADGKVAIFKQGKDWYLSLEGAVGNLIDMGINTLVDAASNKAKELTESLTTKVNTVIYDAYTSTKDNVDDILTDVMATGENVIGQWSDELVSNLRKAESDESMYGLQETIEMAENVGQGIKGEFRSTIGEVKDKFDAALGTAQEKAVMAVSRAGDKILEKTEGLISGAGEKVKDFMKNNLSKVIPVGEVVNTGEKSNIKMGYSDYMYFYLFTMDSDLKLKRIQAVLQANLKVGGLKEFRMETAPASVWADLECSMKYMFLSDVVVPEKIRQNGRLRLKTISAQSY